MNELAFRTVISLAIACLATSCVEQDRERPILFGVQSPPVPRPEPEEEAPMDEPDAATTPEDPSTTDAGDVPDDGDGLDAGEALDAGGASGASDAASADSGVDAG